MSDIDTSLSSSTTSSTSSSSSSSLASNTTKQQMIVSPSISMILLIIVVCIIIFLGIILLLWFFLPKAPTSPPPPPPTITNDTNLSTSPARSPTISESTIFLTPPPVAPPIRIIEPHMGWKSVGFLMQKSCRPLPPPPKPHPQPKPCTTCSSTTGCTNNCQWKTYTPQMDHYNDQSHRERCEPIRKLPLYVRPVFNQRNMYEYMAMDVRNGIEMQVLVPRNQRELYTNDVVRVRGEPGEWMVEIPNSYLFWN